MNILAFDTSTDKFSLAIYKKNKIIYYYQKILNKDYSKKLIPIIQESLKKTRIKIEEIDFISISLGPGSFTGIRSMTPNAFLSIGRVSELFIGPLPSIG